MDVKKILFINTETSPYMPDSEMAVMGKLLPETFQSKGYEIRTFMPKWGVINERRGQLHEVIRLSGMNIIIDDSDHPLLIKVASIPTSRTQVYFIDNEDYFAKRGVTQDDDGNDYTDNGERAIFFARGVLETVKKLRWTPDVIICQGWMTSIVPLYVKCAYQDEPCFKETKVISSFFRPVMNNDGNPNFKRCLKFRDVDESMLTTYNDTFDLIELGKIAADYSDAIMVAGENVKSAIVDHAKGTGKPFATCNAENFLDNYKELFEVM